MSGCTAEHMNLALAHAHIETRATSASLNRVGGLGKLGQDVASGFSFIRILKQKIDGMRNHIDYPLPRPMAAGEEFQVLNAVVGSNPIDVVDGFSRQKLSPQVLFHHVSVLKRCNFLLSWFGRNGNPHISVLTFERNGWNLRLGCDHRFAMPFSPAVGAAHDLFLANQASVRMSRIERLTAVLTLDHKGVSRFPSNSTARNGAVARIASMLLAVASKFTRISGKRVAAGFASELDRINQLPRAIDHFSFAVALRTAVLGTFFRSLSVDGERGIAVRANEIYGQILYSLFNRRDVATSNKYQIHTFNATLNKVGAI